MSTEFKRLGKPGAYRLGRLRHQGTAPQAPAPFVPRFTRPEHYWPVRAWVCGALGGVVLTIAGAAIGWWFMPFAIGLAGGIVNRHGGWSLPVALPAVATIGLLGWAVPLAWSAANGQSVGAAVRRAAGFGLPGSGTVLVLLTLVVPTVEAATGYWLGRALTPRPPED